MHVRVRREIHNNSYIEPKSARRWQVVVRGEVVETGFMSREAAERFSWQFDVEDMELLDHDYSELPLAAQKMWT